jgi:deoxyribodipyrimidine photo-lyase
MTPTPTIVWFRLDLRLSDNPALAAAAQGGGPVLPLFVWAPQEEGAWPPGAASRWWLQRSLEALDADLRRRGSRLLARRGPSLRAIRDLVAETGAGAVHWNRRYEPAAVAAEAEVAESLEAAGLACTSWNAALLFEPGEVRTRSGGPFQVFTPFWNACLSLDDPPAPSPAPGSLQAPRTWPASLKLSDLDLDPGRARAAGLEAAWSPGEKGATKALERFLEEALEEYPRDRDRPEQRGTSRLSPHLHFGEIGPRQIWHALGHRASGKRSGLVGKGTQIFRKEIGWREFAHHLLVHFPHTTDRPLRPEFEAFPWRAAGSDLVAWREGRTGYPIVDAGMRELAGCGWMHNRVRMVVASFLVKDLLLPWQDGARWFWDTLVDADLANNTLGWQWSAGCGADAAPYFRIFNPTLQGERFDPNGDYVRRWVPELEALPARYVHRPWDAPSEEGRVMAAAPRPYPAPMVDHGAARVRALAALGAIRKEKRAPTAIRRKRN